MGEVVSASEVDYNVPEDPSHISKYLVCDRVGHVVGMCDDYEGFIACVKHISLNNDIGFPHNADQTEFWCTDACNRTIYYPKPNLGNM